MPHLAVSENENRHLPPIALSTQELTDFAASVGFDIPNIAPDGKIYRFDRKGKKNAWYVAFQIFGSKSGEPFFVMTIGDWKTSEKHEYKSNRKYSREDAAAIKRKVQEASQKAERERQIKQEEVAIESANMVSRLRHGKTDYTDRKQITVSTLVDGNDVIIPTQDIDGKIWGVQRILPSGQKFFAAGQRVTGTFHIIGEPDSDHTIYIAEGYATGASIHQATGKPVVIAFNASNLVPVAKSCRRQFVNHNIIIAGDDDFETEGNPGRTKAEEASAAALGRAVFPRFKDRETGHTDFNDLHVIDGIDAVKEQLLESEPPPPTGFIPLGFSDGAHFFLHRASNSIKRLTSFGSADLFELMPLEYWESCYPGSKSAVNWDQAKSDLIKRSNEVGQFNHLRVRGAGVWRDIDGTLVINDGNPQRENGHYIYLASSHRFVVPNEGATTKETAELADLCESFKWTEPHSGKYLSGWLAIARIAGALPVRPHVWLTGGSGSGKTTVQERLICMALGSRSAWLSVVGASTEAGIRQQLRADAIPLVYDEFETISEGTRQRVEAVIELLRSAWSPTSAVIAKGSSGGISSLYAINSPALVSSIRVVLSNDADRSRFTVLELKPHGNDKGHWIAIKGRLANITAELGDRIFRRQINNIGTIIKSYQTLVDALSAHKSVRYSQQHGMLLAGYFSLIQDHAVTTEQAEATAREIAESDPEAIERDDEECLAWLLDYRTSYYAFLDHEKRVNVQKSVHQIIVDGDDGELKQLADIGIKLADDGKALYISSNHHMLKRHVFAGTRWQECWYRSLLRYPGAEKSHGNKRFGPHTSKSVKIPLGD